MQPEATLSETEHPPEDARVPVAVASPVRHGVAAGRYLLLDALGAGAEGTVYAAWDPQLDRKLALRLVPWTDEGERERLLRSARALAKLSHPNVVTIHDAGDEGDCVWIAMELVAGATLDAWARARGRRGPERVRVLTEVARGLAAAHAAGLVHRGLDPHRVMVDADGRVRVTGFVLAPDREPADDQLEWSALARALLHGEAPFVGGASERWGASSDVRSLAGGSRSLAGGSRGLAGGSRSLAGDSRSLAGDSRSVAGASRSGIDRSRSRAGDSRGELGRPGEPRSRRGEVRVRPVRVPGWLRRIMDRAAATAPGHRWPSMAALVAALERGRARARVRTAAAMLVGVVALVAGAEGQRQWALTRRTAACEHAGAAIDAVWNDDARKRLRVAFAATKVSFAATTADKVMPWLDERAAAWQAARTEACLAAEAHGTWSEDTYDRALWCLEEQQLAMASLVDELGRADATAVQKAVAAVASPSPSTACTDEDLLLRQPAPPTQGRAAIREVREALSRARSLSLAGRYADALEATGHARARAEGLGWPPLWAAARALEADLLERTGSFDAAEAASAEAFAEAGRTGEWKVAAEAAMLASWIESRLARTAEGRVWAEHAALAIARGGDPAGLLESTRLQTLANGYRAAGDLDEARALHERALAILETVLGPEHPSVASCLNNLASVHADAGDPAAAQRLYERALAIREQALGPDHPDVAGSLTNLGATTAALGDHEAARELFERALSIRVQALGPDHPDVASSLSGLANVHGAAGRVGEARALHERALAVRERALGPEHPEVGTSLANLAQAYLAMGQAAKGQALLERAVRIWESVLGADHPMVTAGRQRLASAQEAASAERASAEP